MNYIRGLILNLILLALAFAKGSTVEKSEVHMPATNVVFEVVQTIFPLDKSTVSTANLEVTGSTNFLHLTLKPEAENIISGLTRQETQAFIKSIHS